MKTLRLLAAGLILLGLSSAIAAKQWPNSDRSLTNGVVIEVGGVAVSASDPLPVAATITPSGTQNVNLTQILGAAPSLTNPLWVIPATGASFAVTGPLTDAQLRAVAVPVSGTVTASGPVTDAQLRATPVPIAGSSYPSAAVPITISATGTTDATVGTLAASALVKTYICGFSIRANATAAATGNATVVGPVTGTMNFTQWTAPLASGIGVIEQTFTPCVPSSAINTAIVVTSAAPGAGGVVSVSAWGYQAP